MNKYELGSFIESDILTAIKSYYQDLLLEVKNDLINSVKLNSDDFAEACKIAMVLEEIDEYEVSLFSLKEKEGNDEDI